MRHPGLLVLPCAFLLLTSDAKSAVGDAEFVSLRRMIGQEKYDDAITVCIDLIRQHPDALTLYETLPEVAQYAGNIDRAIAFLDSRVDDGTALPLVYYGLGTAFYSKHDYRAAVVYFNNAVEAGNATPECYRGLEYAYEKLEGIDAATRYFNLLCHRDPQNPNNWYGLALAYWTRQDYDRVKSCLSEALARKPGERRYIQAQVAAAYLRGETDSVAGVMNKLIASASEEFDFGGKQFLKSFVVIGHFNRDRYQSAIQTIEEIINDSKTYGFLRWLGWGYKRMSDVRFLMGEYQTAISFAKEAASVAERTGDEELLLASLSREFEVFTEQGDYSDALETAYRKHNLAQERGMLREGIRAMGDIAWTLHSLGSDEIALEYAIEGLGRSDAFRSDLRLLYPLQTILGLIYEGLGEYNEAVKHFSFAANLIPKDDVWRRSVAVMHGQLGRAFLKLRDFSEAKRHLILELKLARAEGYEREITFAEAYLGMLYLAQGKLVHARHVLESSYERGCRLNQIPSILTSARGLSILAERAGRLSEAVLWREKSIDAAESLGMWHERLLSLSGGDRDLLADYQEYVRLLCASRHEEQAFEAAEKAKSLSLAKLVSISQIEKSTVLTDPRRARLLRMQGDIIRLHNKIASGDRPLIPSNSNDSTLGLISGLNHLEVTFQRLLDSLRNDKDKLFGLMSPMIHSVREVRTVLLQPEQVLIEYTVGESATTVILIRPDSIFSYTIKVSQRELRELIMRISKVYFDGQQARPVMNAAIADFNNEELHEAYEILLRRAIELSGRAKSIIIVPDGILSNLSFETLVMGWGCSNGRTDRNKASYVIGQFEIKYALSASSTLNLMSRSQKASQLILAIGDAVGLDRSDGLGEPNYILGNDSRVNRSLRSYPGVRHELGAIKNLFSGAATVLSREDATPIKFCSEASQYRILHLAAHVEFDESRPLYSFVALSHNDDGEGHSRLRAIDFLSLDLNADLVVLSGCNTGRLSMRSGLDGMKSVTMISGVSSVISSLWNVEDEVTATLMESFYRHLRDGTPSSTALRLAKLEMIKTGKSDPFYWGAFVLCGDGGRIEMTGLHANRTLSMFLPYLIVVSSAICFFLIIRHRRRAL